MPNQPSHDPPDPPSPASQAASAQAPSADNAASVYPEAETFSEDEAALESLPLPPDDAPADAAEKR